MAPTLVIGDMIFTRKLRGSISRGQVVVHRFGGKPYIKRVVAGPGDTVAMRGGQLIVNSRAVDEPYAERDTVDPVYSEFGWQAAHVDSGATGGAYKPSLHTWGPLVVPPDNYFVLGDSRNNSADSRFFGFVPRDSITATPTIVYFSSDPETGAVRWSRIGKSVAR